MVLPSSRRLVARSRRSWSSRSQVLPSAASRASEVAAVSNAAAALPLSSARATHVPADASSGSSRSWRCNARSAKSATSGSVSTRASPRSRSRTGAPRRSTCPGVRNQSSSSSLGAKRASRAPMTSGESQSFSTMFAMLSTIFARRVGMMAVCGMGRPSGWRKSAVTANQSASAPTVAASKPAASSRSHGSPANGPVTRPIRQATIPPTAHSSEIVPT